MGSAEVLRETRQVTDADSAERWGNVGLPVLSTPAILGTVEVLCDALMKKHLDAGQMTVGVSATMQHRAPVKVGRTIEYEISAPAFARRMEFSFRVLDEAGEAVSVGTHERAVIDVQKFTSRLAD
ncbi:hypothetical protein GCM10010211_82010 [Streptomyces albospinus]|uniref:Fluoroacetyl-CoA-specific thioesterase-like domain-containing protein n=1 Tax=Streptomyces albospinus TaxID=285515 RepID=A0ABQ2VNH4_9ACTN|nr:hypothetical protein [Streptomyces albospinus]GGV02263.1 hypothetical protein GCM10010211_82010 [Streptomyces albospinus]